MTNTKREEMIKRFDEQFEGTKMYSDFGDELKAFTLSEIDTAVKDERDMIIRCLENVINAKNYRCIDHVSCERCANHLVNLFLDLIQSKKV